MANIKITALPEATQVTNSDYTVIDDGVTTKKIAFNNVLDSYMKNVSSPTNDDILITDANGQAVDSGVKIVDITNTQLVSNALSIPSSRTAYDLLNLYVSGSTVEIDIRTSTGNWNEDDIIATIVSNYRPKVSVRCLGFIYATNEVVQVSIAPSDGVIKIYGKTQATGTPINLHVVYLI